jgi:hypothetical protein
MFNAFWKGICPFTLPVRWNPQHISHLTVSEPFPQLRGSHLLLSNVLQRISRSRCEPLYMTDTSHRKQETFLYEYPLHWVLLSPPQKKNRTLFFGSTPSSKVAIFTSWNQPLIMLMRVCYVDCNEAGLCCYLAIHIGNLFRQIKLFF